MRPNKAPTPKKVKRGKKSLKTSYTMRKNKVKLMANFAKRKLAEKLIAVLASIWYCRGSLWSAVSVPCLRGL